MSTEDPMPCPSFRSGFLFTSVKSRHSVPSVYNIDSAESGDFWGVHTVLNQQAEAEDKSSLQAADRGSSRR